MKLSNGKPVKVDLSQITVKEYGNLKNPAFLDDDSYSIVEKCTGFDKAVLEEMSMDDMRKLIGEIIKTASRPILDSGDPDNPS